MKHEIYSCLKMLESLHNRTVTAYNLRSWDTCYVLGSEYERILKLLKNHLSENQYEFLPTLTNIPDRFLSSTESLKAHLLEISTICKISISYLESLEMDLNKELRIKKEEIDQKEKEIEMMQTMLNKSIEAIKRLPELYRSQIVEETKKSHRSIEENSRQKEN